MASKMSRDVGGGRRRGNAGFNALAWCVLLMLVVLPGCETKTPTSPNNPNNLTGQTTNSSFVFTGSLKVSSSSPSLPADDLSSIVIEVEVKDQSGNPIPNLTTVTFSTNLGAFQTVDESNNPILVSAVQAVTFNGLAQAFFQSAGGATGVATITAQIGTVSNSSSVTLTPPPLDGLLQLAFGSTGTAGTTTLTGVASTATPLDANIAVSAFDSAGFALSGANISFRIVEDTTADNTTNPNAQFLVSRHTTTGPDGTAVNVVRAFGPGTVAVVAELYDANTGALVATSNRIILTTSTTFLISQLFEDGTTTFTFLPTELPGTVGITATVTNTAGAPQAGLTVQFTITADSTDAGASLSSSQVVTNAAGLATTSVTVPDNAAGTGTSVSVLAQVVNSAGTVLATSNVIVAIGSF